MSHGCGKVEKRDATVSFLHCGRYHGRMRRPTHVVSEIGVARVGLRSQRHSHEVMKSMRRTNHTACRIPTMMAVGIAASLIVGTAIAANETPIMVGVAKVDITPDYPIRLNGFGHR